jgi:hypothetical protein
LRGFIYLRCAQDLDVTDNWGDLDEEEKKENELFVKEGFRILSA